MVFVKRKVLEFIPDFLCDIFEFILKFSLFNFFFRHVHNLNFTIQHLEEAVMLNVLRSCCMHHYHIIWARIVLLQGFNFILLNKSDVDYFLQINLNA